MKSFIKKIIKTILIFGFVFSGTVFADASFVSDPSTQGNGITTIADNFYGADDYNSITLDIPNKGDSEEFYVFMSYQNAQSYTLQGVKALMNYNTTGSSSSVVFEGTLSASNGGSRSDSARLTNLPSGWKIDFLEARAQNDHGSECGSQYDYDIRLRGLFDNGADLGNLDTNGRSSTNGYTGACSQGHVIAKFKITNNAKTVKPENYRWDTTSWGSCIDDKRERTVFCEDTSDNKVSNSLCNQDTKPESIQYDCGTSSYLDVETEGASNIDTDSVRLNGDLLTGGPADRYWFVLSDSQNLTCNSTSGVRIYHSNAGLDQIGGGSNPDFFVDVVNGLQEDRRYWYRACVREGNEEASGNPVSFRTDGIGGGSGDDEPDATTDRATNIDEDSAELNGEIDMNDFDDGYVFFVWGEDERDVDDVDSEDSYSDIREQGDDLQKEGVKSNFDRSDSFDLDIRGLDRDERHYFRICVEYYDNGDELECGNVRDFSTDDDNNNDDIDIETTFPEDVGTTFATLCGDLQDNGGDRSLRTRIEFKRANRSSWVTTKYEQRREGEFCVRASNLDINTRYQYRACTDGGECGNIRNFTTSNIGGGPVSDVSVNTLAPTAVTTSSAILNGRYLGSDNEATLVWFEWGTTQGLGVQKRISSRSALAGDFSDSFTGLRACTDYYYRAVAQNSVGIDYGNVYRFKTSCVVGESGPDVVVIDEVEEETIDLDLLGLGLSLIRLEIDNDQEAVFRDQSVEYEVTWENISTIDLVDIDLKISVPDEVDVTNISRGRFDADENNIYYTIDDLQEGEDGFLIISGVVSRGSLGDLVTAEAAAAYDNPINDAQENATDYDTDEFVISTNFGTASVFGLSNITFLGWLTILLGLLIIFLIARWLYLEREEMKAQAYANAYRRPVFEDPRYGYQGQAPLGSAYPDQQLPGATQQAASNQAPVDDGYQPYRPNRS